MAGPDFLLIGAQRAGTSSMFLHLMKNPALATVSNQRKETHYFSGTGSRWDPNPLCDNEVEPYLRLTTIARRRRNTTNLQVGDFSPTHLHCLCCAASLRMINRNMKVVVLLRDPVARAVSKFFQLKQPHSRWWPEQQALENHTFVSYVEAELAVMRRCSDTARRFRSSASPRSRLLAAAGAAMPRGWGAGWDMGQWMEAQCYARSSILGWSVYAPFLENYAAQFGWRQMKVLYTPDMLAAPNVTLRAVEDFLGAPRVRLHPMDKLDFLFNTRECHFYTCPRKRGRLKPLAEALGAHAGGGASGGGGLSAADAALVDDMGLESGGLGSTSSSTSSGNGNGASTSSSASSSASPFGQAVAALRQFYAPHVQQLFTWADQGVIPQPPPAWRAVYGLPQQQQPAG
ncbi:hypothetical protein HXX76_014740 [Chlamydomonas incerta]|uniref:Sulfotransferase n=1 Tax=Chlamydomonas incerta TaxID=51695 RepID=A0A835SBF7_CHLIN|nr:hypothetical protein HXX76_014740 [Chlamydomonas incerta]|eukprot:KAG2424208.1 hypothetical protein HXX76_014740 [Chlamydomonas incerta]